MYRTIKGYVNGLQVAVKAPRLGSLLGYGSSAAAIRREMKLAVKVRHPCLCSLLGWFAGPVAFSAWEFAADRVQPLWRPEVFS